ncbi:MAG: cadmium-translocating P-type ATPase [Oscillospiraceae bacterium]|jgi:Cd2+/Zn2+-exporting ATPase|nr:cadmium-translocating P-type ATPase [Oscillospiraceae bacterium]
MTKKQKRVLYRILIAGALLLVQALVPDQIFLGERWVLDFTGEWVAPADWVSAGYTLYLDTLTPFLLYMAAYLIIGYDVLRKAVLGIVHGEIFDENFLMAVATVGAILLGSYGESVEVMLFYQIGELFQSVAVGKSRRSITELMDIRPDYANIEVAGQLKQVDPEEVAVEQIIVIRPGERVPLDGVVVEGASALNTSALTGESLPREVSAGDEVVSGCVNTSGLLRVRVTKPFGESTVSKILDLVENSSLKKAKAENFITKFARYYTPAVCIGAALLAVIPPLLLGGGWAVWVRRALTFLVISCPCALVISIPLSFFGGIGGASRSGILVKGGNYLEALSAARTVVFDKTGTLTQGVFAVAETCPAEGIRAEALLETAALAECYSSHPISLSLRQSAGIDGDGGRVSGVEEIAGHGVTAVVDGRRVAVGNARLMTAQGVDFVPNDHPGTVVYAAIDGTFAGSILISDQLKATAAGAVRSLRSQGLRTVMLTGDNAKTAQAVGEALGLDEIHSDLLPAGKVEQLERLLVSKPPRSTLAFVGDGINDAPVLSRADIGIAMGAMGSDAAIEAADIVLMDDDPAKIALAMSISRKCLRIVKENIIFALGVKAACLILGAAGIAGMQAAIFADVGVMVLAVLNAARTLRVPQDV